MVLEVGKSKSIALASAWPEKQNSLRERGPHVPSWDWRAGSVGNDTCWAHMIARVWISLSTLKARCSLTHACGPRVLGKQDYWYLLASSRAPGEVRDHVLKEWEIVTEQNANAFFQLHWGCSLVHVQTCEHIQCLHICPYKKSHMLSYILESQRLHHSWGKSFKPPCLFFLLYSVYYYYSLFPASICHRKSIQGQHLTYPQLPIACSQREKKEEKRNPLLSCLTAPKAWEGWHCSLLHLVCLPSPIYFTCLHNAFYEAYKSQMGIISLPCMGSLFLG